MYRGMRLVEEAPRRTFPTKEPISGGHLLQGEGKYDATAVITSRQASHPSTTHTTHALFPSLSYETPGSVLLEL